MEKPQAALGGLTPEQALIEWRYIPSTVRRLERMSWAILAFAAGASAGVGWKLWGSAPPVHAAEVIWRLVGGA